MPSSATPYYVTLLLAPDVYGCNMVALTFPSKEDRQQRPPRYSFDVDGQVIYGVQIHDDTDPQSVAGLGHLMGGVGAALGGAMSNGTISSRHITFTFQPTATMEKVTKLDCQLEGMRVTVHITPHEEAACHRCCCY